MATIASVRLVRMSTYVTSALLGTVVRDVWRRFVYGRAVVSCEECGRCVPPNAAVWRGAHPYCSAEHEVADSV